MIIYKKNILKASEFFLVLEPGFDSLQKSLELCLDDFARVKRVVEVQELKELSLCVSAPSRFPQKWLQWYYRLAMNNLQKAAPNLRTLELNGGYVYMAKDVVGPSVLCFYLY